MYETEQTAKTFIMKRAPEYKGIEVQGMAQYRAGLPVRTGTRIQRTKSTMKGGEGNMEEKTFLTVDEIAEILTVSKSKAYEIVRQRG